MDFLIEYNGGELNRQNHNSDNSFFVCQKKYEFEEWLRMYDCIFLGFSIHFEYKSRYVDDIAFVYQDSDDNVWWSHFPAISVWKCVESNLSEKEQHEKARNFLEQLGFVPQEEITKICLDWRN